MMGEYNVLSTCIYSPSYFLSVEKLCIVTSTLNKMAIIAGMQQTMDMMGSLGSPELVRKTKSRRCKRKRCLVRGN